MSASKTSLLISRLLGLFPPFLQHFCTEIRSDFRVLEVAENGIEAVAVLQRH